MISTASFFCRFFFFQPKSGTHVVWRKAGWTGCTASLIFALPTNWGSPVTAYFFLLRREVTHNSFP